MGMPLDLLWLTIPAYVVVQIIVLLRLIETGRVDSLALTKHRFPFKDIEKAFSLMQTKEDGMIKPLIRPWRHRLRRLVPLKQCGRAAKETLQS